MQKKKIRICVQGYVKSMLKMCALGYLFFRNTGIAIGIFVLSFHDDTAAHAHILS